MKKLLIILLAGFFIAGCSGNDGEENRDEEENGGDQVEENNDEDNTQSEDGDEQKDVYQIGETAKTTSSSYGFPYEVTVNDFNVTTDEVDGHSLEDYLQGAERGENTRFAVVNVTLKNTGDEPFVPNEKMSAQLIGELTYQESWDEIFTERDNELNAGEEITGNLVYISDNLYEDGVVYMSYETGANEEVKFELPVPEQ